MLHKQTPNRALLTRKNLRRQHGLYVTTARPNQTVEMTSLWDDGVYIHDRTNNKQFAYWQREAVDYRDYTEAGVGDH